MATRQNKKRKGRNNAPPRERTVTTLTDGPDGPFMSSPADDSSASLMSPPFSVSSPIPPSPQPPGITPSPFPLQPFSAPFPYSFSHMPSIGSSLSGSFQPQAPPPQFFSSQPSAIQQSTPLAPSQQPADLPQGQNDLEILERLKETIKSNQHELFRPIPQPAALAGVFLGPRSTLVSSHVPPHPEQIPTDTSPPGLTRITPDNTRSTAEALLAKASKQSTSSTPDLRDAALRKPAHRLSISESPKQNTMQPPQSPVKRVDRYDSAAHSASGLGRQDKPGLNGAGSSPRFGNVDASPRMGPPGSQRLEQGGRSESLVGQLATALTIEIVQVLLQLARLATWTVVGRYQEMNGHMIARKNGCATENVVETETTIGTRIVTGDPITVGSEMTDVQTTALVHPMTADLYLQVTGATIHAALVGTTPKHLSLRSRLVTIESLPMHVRHRVI
ncbi:hypothetical protein C8Q74DRAFT_1216823 [Fomes fomentarius]|nr:hypothetical protein C8Q74DRAFT_1216823 [Fomes fomentarius]